MQRRVVMRVMILPLFATATMKRPSLFSSLLCPMSNDDDDVMRGKGVVTYTYSLDGRWSSSSKLLSLSLSLSVSCLSRVVQSPVDVVVVAVANAAATVVI